MAFLLDTHIFLWFISGDEKLKPAMRALISDPKNRRLMSIVSLWEIVVKVSLGKLPTKGPISYLIQNFVKGNDIQLLPFEAEHLDILETLPLHHRDPFDRLIVAQSLSENLPIISADEALDAYGVNRLW